MNGITSVLSVVAAFMAFDCHKSEAPDAEPPHVEFVSTAEPPKDPPNPDAVAACENLVRLGCAEGGPSPKGVPCSTWMFASREYLPLQQIARAHNKSELLKWGVKCEGR